MDAAAAVQAALANDVAYLLSVSVDLQGFAELRALAERFANVWCSVGVHPNTTGVAEPSTAELVTLAQSPHVVAVGETGLDFYRGSGDLGWQVDLRKQ